MDIGPQLAAVSQDTSDSRWLSHFISIINPLSELSLLLANVYQYQTSQPKQQAALLTLIKSVVELWSSHADHVVVGGDFNASLLPRKGYAGLPHIRAADGGQTRILPHFCTTLAWRMRHLIMMSIHGIAPTNTDEQRVFLDWFMWRSRSGQASVSNAGAYVRLESRTWSTTTVHCV